MKDYKTIASHRKNHALLFEPILEDWFREKSRKARKYKMTFEQGHNGELCRIPMSVDRYKALMKQFFEEVSYATQT